MKTSEDIVRRKAEIASLKKSREQHRQKFSEQDRIRIHEIEQKEEKVRDLIFAVRSNLLH